MPVFFKVEPDLTSRVCVFQVHFIIFSSWCYHTSFFLLFFSSSKSSLCIRRQVRSLEAKNEPSLLGLRACFPLIVVSWMKINGEALLLSASALGTVRKLNYGDSFRARFNNICIIRSAIPLGIVALLLSHTPNRPSPKRLRPFSQDRPTNRRPFSAAASFNRDELLLKRLARTLR